jgi:hypothetical protein
VSALAIEIVTGDVSDMDEFWVQNAQLLLDNQSAWAGKLKRGTLWSKEAHPYSTFVFMVATAEVRRLVLGDGRQSSDP